MLNKNALSHPKKVAVILYNEGGSLAQSLVVSHRATCPQTLIHQWLPGGSLCESLSHLVSHPKRVAINIRGAT